MRLSACLAITAAATAAHAAPALELADGWSLTPTAQVRPPLLGLIDIGGRLDLAPLRIDGHHFRTAEPDGADASTLGTEIDASVRWAATEGVALRVLYGVFLPAEAMGSVRGLADDPATEHLGFVTADITL